MHDDFPECDQSNDSPKCYQSNDSSECDQSNDSPKCDQSNDSTECAQSNDSPKCDQSNDSSECDQSYDSPECDQSNDSPECDQSNDSPECDQSNDSPECDQSNDSPECDQSLCLVISWPPLHDIILCFLVSECDRWNDVCSQIDEEQCDRPSRQRNGGDHVEHERSQLGKDVGHRVRDRLPQVIEDQATFKQIFNILILLYYYFRYSIYFSLYIVAHGICFSDWDVTHPPQLQWLRRDSPSSTPVIETWLTLLNSSDRDETHPPQLQWLRRDSPSSTLVIETWLTLLNSSDWDV